MGKYEPLTAFLSGVGTEEVRMTFSEIERVIGGPLPASKQYAAWWSNNPSNNVMTRAWLKAGFRTERVEPAAGRLVFRRSGGMAPKATNGVRDGGPGQGFVADFQARFGGAFTIRPGVDLTQPTGEVWDAERD